jgi:hypothetical protein
MTSAFPFLGRARASSPQDEVRADVAECIAHLLAKWARRHGVRLVVTHGRFDLGRKLEAAVFAGDVERETALADADDLDALIRAAAGGRK